MTWTHFIKCRCKRGATNPLKNNLLHELVHHFPDLKLVDISLCSWIINQYDTLAFVQMPLGNIMQTLNQIVFEVFRCIFSNRKCLTLFLPLVFIALTILWILNASNLHQIVMHSVVSQERNIPSSYLKYYDFENVVAYNRHTGASQKPSDCIDAKLEVWFFLFCGGINTGVC